MTVQIENRDNGIQIVRLTGASASKSFSRESLPIIADAIDKGLKNPEIRGMVITGEGKFFSAGADINAFQESIEANEAPQLIRDLTNILHPLLMRIRESSTIVVRPSMMRDSGGLGLTLACDARIASPKAKLATSYASIGLSPDGGTTWLLPRLVGEQRSRQFFFENQIWNAEESANAGAIDEVVNEDELINRSIEIATDWSQWGNHFEKQPSIFSTYKHSTILKHTSSMSRLSSKVAGTTMEFKDGVSVPRVTHKTPHRSRNLCRPFQRHRIRDVQVHHNHILGNTPQ